MMSFHENMTLHHLQLFIRWEFWFVLWCKM